MIGPANKQINKQVSAFVRATNFSVAAGANNSDVTVAIASVLSTAGDGNTAVPLQALTTSNKIGVVVSAPDNRVEISHFTKKNKIAADSVGSEVYGRLTEYQGIFRLYYYWINPLYSNEATYTFPATTAIDFDFAYRYSFDKLPSDGIIRVSTRTIDDDADPALQRQYSELRTPFGASQMSALTKTPDDISNVKLHVNTATYHTLGTNPAFTVSGKNITWSSVNAGFDLTATDLVIVEYTSIE